MSARSLHLPAIKLPNYKITIKSVWICQCSDFFIHEYAYSSILDIQFF